MRAPARLFLVALLVGPFLAAPVAAQAPFVRGDFNGDGQLDISDPVRILIFLFAASFEPACASSGDVDASGGIEITDAVRLLNHLFARGDPPADPFPACGADPSSDSLGCAEHPPCAPRNSDPEITEWAVPWPSSRPRDPYVDDRGRVWFVGQTADYAAFLDPVTGDFTRFDLGGGTGPHNLIVDEEFVWYAGNRAAHIGKLDPADGRITRIPMPLAAARDPHTLIFDSQGNIWFTVQNGNFVGRLVKSSGEVSLISVPTSRARPYGIVVDSTDSPWFVEFGTNKLGTVDTARMAVREFPLPRSGARPRRLGVTSDDAIWYVDYSEGYLGRFTPADGGFEEWRLPGGSSSRPYGMAVDHRDRIWLVETGRTPNRFVGFDPVTAEFFGITPLESGGGSVRHMYFHEPTREVWFGTDANTVGRAWVE